jgi:hypothetical protein
MGVFMTASEEKIAAGKAADKLAATEERNRIAQQSKLMKSILWAGVIGSLLTLFVMTSTGWLTTQKIVEDAREEGQAQIATLRANICFARFEQRPDAAAKLAEFEAMSWADKEDVAQKFVAEEGLATMTTEDGPVPGAVENCAEMIVRS